MYGTGFPPANNRHFNLYTTCLEKDIKKKHKKLIVSVLQKKPQIYLSKKDGQSPDCQHPLCGKLCG